jgi:beta-glucosidase
VTLTNTGARAGSEVVQLYVRALDARYEAPRSRLADFRKVRLEAGESRLLTFRLPIDQLAHWDVETGAFTVDPGGYEVLVARSAENVVLTAPLTVIGPQPSSRAGVGRTIAAVDFDDYEGLAIVDTTRVSGDAVTPADPSQPASLWFRSTDLSGAVRVEAEVAYDGEPGEARLRFWAHDRLLLAEIAVPVTGDRYEWTTVSAQLPAPAEGVHDLRVTLHGGVRLATFRLDASA